MSNISVSVNKLLISTAFLCSILSMVMASIELSVLYLIIFLFFVTVGVAIELNYFPAFPRVIINVCAIALLVIILSQLRFYDVIEPFMKIVLVMTAVKMLEKKSVRDYMQLLLLGLMMLICYAMVSIDVSFVLYCFGGGIIWTFIMVLCSFKTKDPHAVISLRDLMQLLSRLSFIFALMIPFCLLMFIITPRVRSPFLGVYSSNRTSQAGFTDHVNLGSTSEISKNKKLAFRAEVARQPYVTYWRGVVMDSFDGVTWRSSQTPTLAKHVIGRENTIRQEIFLEPGRRRYLFALDVPFAVSNVAAQVTGNGEIVYIGRNDGRRLQYTATSAISNAMRVENENFRRGRYLKLPADYIPELRREVERITGGLDNPQKISAILNYLSPPNYEYSLTEMSDTLNALEHFIFINKKGNCEYFASAMGVMLRMAGIPSRLVGGYRGGIYNDTGGYYSVLEENAHAWVELWDERSSSWVRYEPTPPSPLAGSGLEIYSFFEAYLDLLDYHWTKFVLNYNLEIQGEVVQSIKSIISNPRAIDFDSFFEHLPLISGVIALVFITVYFLRRVMLRDMSKALLNNFIRIMSRKGYYIHKSEGLREFSNRLPEHESTKAMPFINRFEEHYYKDIEFDEMTVKTLKNNLKELNNG